MDLKGWKNWLGASGRTNGGRFVLPETILEIAPGFVFGARLDRAKKSVRRVGLRMLDSAAMEPDVGHPNILNAAELARAFAGVTELIGAGGEMGLLIPDAAARVTVLTLETLPDNPGEVQALIAWKIKEVLPFGTEEARLSYQVMERGEKQVELLAVAVRAGVLAEYEAPVESLGGGLALLLPSSIALLGLLPAIAEAQILLHVAGGGLTTVVVERDRVRLWKRQALASQSLTDCLGEIAAEASRVLASAQERLMLHLRHVWLCARPPIPPEAVAELSRAAGRELQPLRPATGTGSNLGVKEQDLYAQYGASVAGALENGR